MRDGGERAAGAEELRPAHCGARQREHWVDEVQDGVKEGNSGGEVKVEEEKGGTGRKGKETGREGQILHNRLLYTYPLKPLIKNPFATVLMERKEKKKRTREE